uniref:Pre-mRNA-splicing factor 18 n=1 Tax=Lygus hesperus TaxID=30085 RepID=A0A0A9XAJ7_LYGHE
MFKDTKKKLQPFFIRLRNNAIEDEILEKVENICKLCQDGNYIGANEEYLKVSIGNAAWPMGATMVGIHERAGREKISSDKVAHIMNDETTRSYLHAIKRLITYSQSISSVAPSRMCPQ